MCAAKVLSNISSALSPLIANLARLFLSHEALNPLTQDVMTIVNQINEVKRVGEDLIGGGVITHEKVLKISNNLFCLIGLIPQVAENVADMSKLFGHCHGPQTMRFPILVSGTLIDIKDIFVDLLYVSKNIRVPRAVALNEFMHHCNAHQ